MAALVREDRNVHRLRQELQRRPGYEANVRLGEAVVAGLNRRAAQVADRAVRELASLADAVTPGPEVAGCVLNTSFLVRRARVDRFREVAVRFAEDHREQVELRVTGPLPCYSFVGGRAAGPLLPGRPGPGRHRSGCGPARVLTWPARGRSGMGLITCLLTLPLAPVRGVTWVAGQLAEAADRELHDPDVLRARLAALHLALENGDIDEEEFEREEERLLDLLERRAPTTTPRTYHG